MRGVALGLYFKEDGRDYDRPLGEIADLHADTVSLVVTWSQQDVRSVEIGPDARETRDDEVVVDAIEEAHENGLRVLLFPILRLQERGPGDWRGRIAPSDVDAWFESYWGFVGHYAALAEQNGVEILSIGSELGSVELYEDRWRQLIARVRASFSGQIMYSANWDHYQNTPFWDAVDLVGLTAYYELTDSLEEEVTLSGLVKRWHPIRDAIVQNMTRIGHPFVFTEVGYYSQVGTAWHPWDYTREGTVDLEQQLLCYQAFYKVWKDVPGLAGVFFWHWFGEGGEGDGSYTPRGKPAEDLIRHWFAQWPSLSERLDD
jgi:hypothetical protein